MTALAAALARGEPMTDTHNPGGADGAAGEPTLENAYDSGWMDTGIAWNESFWAGLDPVRVMHLNPHWHMEKPPRERYEVEDILVERTFTVTPDCGMQCGAFVAAFPEIGLYLAARRQDSGTTALSYRYTPRPGLGFTADDAEKTARYWLPSLREYSRLYEAETLKLRFWRVFMNRVVLTMNPTQRRISGFMFKLTLLEIALIIALGLGWYFFAG
ncbi:MAG: hypothetical protein AB7D51_06970 [Desulfovibrionaceae bacterium]